MIYSEVQPIVIAIMTSIITGGFVLVFVEIGNRKHRENDRYDMVITPFMHKLSAFFRLMSWCHGQIIYPKELNENEKEFKKLLDEMGRYGDRLIMSGGDFLVDSFTAKRLESIAFDINNIWYNQTQNTYLIAKVSGDFYTDVYQPIAYETYRHESYLKQYNIQTILVSFFFSAVLVVLCLMLFLKPPVLFLQLACVSVVLMLITSLLLLAVDIKVLVESKGKRKRRKEKRKARREEIRSRKSRRISSKQC